MNFYPGPSKIYPQVKDYFNEAFEQGILSQNHRSPAFEAMYEETIEALRQWLKIPQDYTICFVSSATEAWEIVAQSLVKKKSYHISNGAFGDKWLQRTMLLDRGVFAHTFGIDDELIPEELDIPDICNAICVTQNETSNGTQIQPADIRALKELFPDKIVAVDATSSMGGIALDFGGADVWFASVQKCFGLPPGLCILAFSPFALEKSWKIDEERHYNSLPRLYENAQKLQTSYTPNTLGIYLMGRLAKELPSIEETEKRLNKQADDLYSYFENHSELSPLVSNPATRSKTVLAIQGQAEKIKSIMKKASSAGITLGKGYGQWKQDTFRIANFPSITSNEIADLKTFFDSL